MKLIDVLVGKSAFEHVYGKGAIQVKYIIIIIIIIIIKYFSNFDMNFEILWDSFFCFFFFVWHYLFEVQQLQQFSNKNDQPH